jgi:hypothetical protein
MGGVGKSVLANAVARDEAIQRRFSDGVCWISMGQAGAGQEAKAMALQSQLSLLLGEPHSITSATQGREHLRTLLADRAYLIVLDDVWDVCDARWMDVAGPRSRILLTTRDGSLVSDLDAKEHRLGLLPPDQAATLLEKWSGRSVRNDIAAQEVVQECGCLPLALAICGAMARDGTSWRAVAAGLKAADVAFLNRQGVDPHYKTILTSIQASVNFLAEMDPDVVGLYLSLAVFPPARPVPEEVVAMYWRQATDCSPWRSEIHLVTLANKSLLSLEGKPPRRRVSLHDLHHDYVRHSHPDVPRLHRIFLEAYRSRCSGNWANGPDDGYFFQHLAYHMKEGDRLGELCQLLRDFDWLTAKLRATDVFQLLTDFWLSAEDLVIARIRDALRLSAHHLSRDRTLLLSQLHGRLLGVESPEIQGFLQNLKNLHIWIRCLTPSLTAPGGGLLRTLEGHAHWVSAVALTPDGTRAISASADRTLRVWDLASGELLRTLEGHTRWVGAVALTPDGTRAISASDDWTLKVWDLASGELLRTLEGHADWVRAVAVTPDGTRAVSASADKTLRVWDLASGELLRTLEGHAGPVNSVALAHEGTQAVSASADKTLWVWDLASGDVLVAFAADYPLLCCDISPGGETVMVGDMAGRVHLLRMEAED